MIDFAAKWPQHEDLGRLEKYARYKKFFLGRQKGVFEYLGSKCKNDPSLQRKIYLINNLAGLISRACADLLCGEPASFIVGGESPGSPVQNELDKLIKLNSFHRRHYRLAISASYRGDGVIRLRDDGKQIVIEDLPASQYFVELNPDNQREAISQAIVWVVKTPNAQYLRAEHHEPGRIYQTAHRIKPMENLSFPVQVIEQVDLSEVYASPPPDVARTGVEIPLLFHLPNFELDDEFYGISDYNDVDTLFEAINNRMSKVDSYLDSHSEPILIGVNGMSDPEGNVDKSRINYFEANNPDEAGSIRYVTWEGQMQAAFQQVEGLKDDVFTNTEVSKALFKTEPGQRFESARAMKTAITGTLNKIKRKSMLQDGVLKSVFHTALRLNEIRHGGTALDERRIDIRWQDGIPQDYLESIQAEQLRDGAGLTSKISAIQRIDRCSPEQAQEELARARAELAATATVVTSQETPGTARGSGANERTQSEGISTGSAGGASDPGVYEQA